MTLAKPLPYHSENAQQLDALVDRYGGQLHKMQPEDRLALLVATASYVYVLGISKMLGEDEQYSLQAAFDDAMPPGNDVTSAEFPAILQLLEGLDIDATLGLLIALCNQLKHGGR